MLYQPTLQQPNTPGVVDWNQRVTSLGDRTNTLARISAIPYCVLTTDCGVDIEDLKEARANENTHIREPGSRKRLALACSGREKQELTHIDSDATTEAASAR